MKNFFTKKKVFALGTLFSVGFFASNYTITPKNYPTVTSLIQNELSSQEVKSDIGRNWTENFKVFLERNCEFGGHLLFNYQGERLAEISSEESSQEEIDITRKNLATGLFAEDIVISKAIDRIGYPFAFSCGSFFRDGKGLEKIIDEFKTKREITGSWDGIHLVNATHEELFDNVYSLRRVRYGISDYERDYLKAIAIVESGLNKNSISEVGAKGLMQLMPGVFNDCGISDSFHYHRIAQVDCAMRIFSQKKKYLKQKLEVLIGEDLKRFDDEEREEFFSILAIQAYNTGEGNLKKVFSSSRVKQGFNYMISEGGYSILDILTNSLLLHFGNDSIGLDALGYVPKVIGVTEEMYKYN